MKGGEGAGGAQAYLRAKGDAVLGRRPSASVTFLKKHTLFYQEKSSLTTTTNKKFKPFTTRENHFLVVAENPEIILNECSNNIRHSKLHRRKPTVREVLSGDWTCHTPHAGEGVTLGKYY